MSTNWHLGEPAPALVAHPVAASLDEAHAAIELWEFYARKKLDDAQILSVEHMLAEGDDGLWAADSTGRAESRQNGKGDEIEVVELWGLTQRGEAILHTAHEAATAASAHNRLRDLILGCPDLRRKLGRNRRGAETVQSWNGNYRIEMADKAFIVHRTRTDAIGRGLDDISRLVVDEAQHAQPEELASATPILAANPNPQKNYIGSAGLASRSKFWWRLRKQALTPDAGRFAWLEHSAEIVTVTEDGRIISSVGDIEDRAAWRRANPAYPTRITDNFLAGQLRDLGPEHFAREHLCVWDPEPGSESAIIPFDLWRDCESQDASDGSPSVFVFDVAPNQTHGAIAAAGTLDGLPLADVLESRSGTGWLVPRLVALKGEHPNARFVAPAAPAPASSLFAEADRAGIEVETVPISGQAAACSALLAQVTEKRMRHRPDEILDAALAGAVKKDTGDGAWLWSRKSSQVNIAPLVAFTVALDAVEDIAVPGYYGGGDE